MPLDLVLTNIEEPGYEYTRSPYIFTLISAFSSYFESTVAIVVTASINNTVLECIGGTIRDRVTVYMDCRSLKQ